VLVLAEPLAPSMADAVAHDLALTVYSLAAVHAAAEAAARLGCTVDVHVKLDTGMHRVGAAPAEVIEVVTAVVANPGLRFAALWTHFPVADCTGPEARAFSEAQLAGLAGVRDTLAARGLSPPALHAANSAGALAIPQARLDMVRCGIALYGAVPFPGDRAPWTEVLSATGADALRPVLTWRSAVTHVTRLEAGARPSYGRLRPLPGDATVATVPLGYADGVPRRYFDAGGTVLVGGRRRPLAGMVTMDQIVVDCGTDDVAVGDEVVLIGEQGEHALTAWEWAEALGTIPHEVFCGIGARVPRVVVDEGVGS
jgi:alanine racemase